MVCDRIMVLINVISASILQVFSILLVIRILKDYFYSPAHYY